MAEEERVRLLKFEFGQLDSNNDEVLSADELHEGLLGRGWDQDEVSDLFSQIDTNKDGTISLDEYLAYYAQGVVPGDNPRNEAESQTPSDPEAEPTKEERSCDVAKRFGIEEVSARAVSVDFLLQFTNKHNLWNKQTWEVVEEVIKPATLDSKLCYVDTFATEMKSEFGPPNEFVSHAWGNRWGLLVAAIEHKRKSSLIEAAPGKPAKKQYFVWLDCFAISQHQALADLEFLDSVVRTSKSFSIVLDSSAKPLSRAWCLFEILHRMSVDSKSRINILAGDFELPKQGGAQPAFVPLDSSTMTQIFRNTDMASAEAKFESDKNMIFELVKKLVPGGFTKINEAIRTAIAQEDIKQTFKAEAGQGKGKAAAKGPKTGNPKAGKHKGGMGMVADMYSEF